CSQASRTAAASTLPRVAPRRRSACRAGWANSEGNGREVGTDDTDNLSSCAFWGDAREELWFSGRLPTATFLLNGLEAEILPARAGQLLIVSRSNRPRSSPGGWPGRLET